MNHVLNSEKDKMKSGQLYNAFDADLVKDRVRASKLCTQLNELGKATQESREKILKKLFKTCGMNVWVESPFICDYGYQISVGSNVFINFNCTILDGEDVTIGNDVLIGPNVQIYSATHPVDWKVRKSGLENTLPVTIGDNVWVGGGVVICPGVTIGNKSTIGAGSVVTKDIPSNVVAAGNPARVIRVL
ncbi:sugar O-acetyltransferase [Desulfogranum japonicum]|uniref:sugar O-acetyltransferase n=1 Tax=Desulfogranum japonicum TaxID=231447 RepID=UPI000416EDD3|nr:sugar O-acetyltransferase [Desulfogranum japonicum]